MRPWPGLAAFAALAISELALGDLPLLGALAGSLLAGVLAALLARDARDAAVHALGAVAGALLLLALLTEAGPVLPGLVPPPAAVVLAQAALLSAPAPCLAWLLARYAPVTWA
jgi:hypothetical protein